MLPHQSLVPGIADRFARMVRQFESLGRCCCQRRESVLRRYDRRQGIVGSESHDGGRGLVDILKANRERAAWSEIG
ncbi:MAG TPA: hypothetical protein EYO20_02875 [Gemmatimonadetes bacterium]|nr:hypothetical protein [Gemmatimonadota bacterium]